MDYTENSMIYRIIIALTLLFLMQMPVQVVNAHVPMHSSKEKRSFWDDYKGKIMGGSIALVAVATAMSGIVYNHIRKKELWEGKLHLMGNEMPEIPERRSSRIVLPIDILSNEVIARLVAEAKTLPELQAVVSNIALVSHQFNNAIAVLRSRQLEGKGIQEEANKKYKAIDKKRIQLVNELVQIIERVIDTPSKLPDDLGTLWDRFLNNLQIRNLMPGIMNDYAKLRKLAAETIGYEKIHEILEKNLGLLIQYFDVTDEEIKQFLINGIDGNKVHDADEKCLLTMLIKEGRFALAQDLIDTYKVNVNTRDKQGNPPIVYALVTNRLETKEETAIRINFAIKLIGNPKFNVYAVYRRYNATLLHITMNAYNKDLVNAVIAHDKNMINDCRNIFKASPVVFELYFTLRNEKDDQRLCRMIQFVRWFIQAHKPDLTLDSDVGTVLDIIKNADLDSKIRGFYNAELNLVWDRLEDEVTAYLKT